eukprot:739866-Alexandrium_andersonii.AAC.3
MWSNAQRSNPFEAIWNGFPCESEALFAGRGPGVRETAQGNRGGSAHETAPARSKWVGALLHICCYTTIAGRCFGQFRAASGSFGRFQAGSTSFGGKPETA